MSDEKAEARQITKELRLLDKAIEEGSVVMVELENVLQPACYEKVPPPDSEKIGENLVPIAAGIHSASVKVESLIYRINDLVERQQI